MLLIVNCILDVQYGQKYWDTPSFEQKKSLPNCGNKDRNIIYVFKNCISISVATVLKCMKWLYPYVIGVWWWDFGSRSAFTVFFGRLGALIFANTYVHFSKQFVQTAPHNGLPAKACHLLKIFSSSLKNRYLCQWTYQCNQNEKSLCHCSQTW